MGKCPRLTIYKAKALILYPYTLYIRDLPLLLLKLDYFSGLLFYTYSYRSVLISNFMNSKLTVFLNFIFSVVL